MILARVPRRPSMQQHDRLPVSTYDEAISRLLQYRIDETLSDDAYDIGVQLVADIFWMPDKRVRADVMKATSALGGL